MKKKADKIIGAGSPKKLYVCKKCRLHFTEKELAEKCAAWDRKYGVCSLEIARHSVEAQKSMLKRPIRSRL